METKSKKVLAVDLGGSSGRVMVAEFDGKKINIDEIHRFTNNPVVLSGTMYWDILCLFKEIKQGMVKAKQYGEIESIAIDTWGVDFGFIDSKGKLISNPVHYRDLRNNGMVNKALSIIEKHYFYSKTGNQFMDINTVFQLLAVKEQEPKTLDYANKIILMPNLLEYFLCGKVVAEKSIASTTQMYNIVEQKWATDIINKLGIPEKLLPDIVDSGSIIGTLTDDICEEISVPKWKVIAAAGHDTEAAVAAVPAMEDDFIFISCGTWSLFGTEIDKPIINENSMRFNITNEQGVFNKSLFLKNIIGLWLIQESRRQWQREGKDFNFGELEEMALSAKPFKCFIDPDDPIFIPAGNIPERIREYCKKTNQPVPKNEGEIVRCINESLALKYRSAMNEIISCTKKSYKTIYMIGGGVQSKLLCKLTASACNLNVSAGPVEATVFGNAACQLQALGVINDLKEIRKVVYESSEIINYKPTDINKWDNAYDIYKEIVNRR